MAIRKTSFAVGEYYHLYNRGNNKAEIFFDKEDYDHFIKLLYLCNTVKSIVVRDVGKNHYNFDRGNTLVNIGAFCLMPNHFHILVKEKEDGGISSFMKKLGTAYVMYLNTRYERSGGLFESKFKSEHVNNDRHLKYLFSYIHLNPLKLVDKNWKVKGLKDKSKASNYLNSYTYSSLADYIALVRPPATILNREVFPDYFPKPADFLKEIGDWMSLTP